MLGGVPEAGEVADELFDIEEFESLLFWNDKGKWESPGTK